jgi:chaperonin cofactor prefoldin
MTDINYIDLPTSRVRYGSLTSPGQLVAQRTFSYRQGGQAEWSDITSYCASHGLTTYFVAVSNPGEDFCFDAGLWLHWSNGTEAYYPYVITGEFGSSGHSMTRGIAGGAAEITLTPITETETLYNELLAQYNTLQSQHNTLLAQYNTLFVQNSTLTSQYNTLVSQYNNLLSQYNALLNQYTTSTSQYNNLQNQYNTLQGQYNSVQDQYSNLQSQYSQLQNLLIAPVILIVFLAISTGYFFSKSRRKP